MYYSHRRKYSTNGWKPPVHHEQKWYDVKKVAYLSLQFLGRGPISGKEPFMDILTVGSRLGRKQKFSFIVLLSLGLMFFLPVFSNFDTARAGIIDQVNAASDGDTVVITEPHLEPDLTWEPTSKLRSTVLDIDSSIILKGDFKRRVECLQLNVKADDVTLNRFEFSHKQDYCLVCNLGYVTNDPREEAAHTYDYNELIATNRNRLTVKNCDFKDNNTYYARFGISNDHEVITSQSKTGGGLVRLDGCDTVVFTNCSFANASAYEGGLVRVTNCTNVLFEDCTFRDGRGYNCGGLVSIKESSDVSFINCTFNKGCSGYGSGGGYGGLITIDTCSNTSFTDCSLKNGSAHSGGGGFNLENSGNCAFIRCSIENCHIINRTSFDTEDDFSAGHKGGGGRISKSTNIDIDDCNFTDNYSMPYQNVMHNYVFRAEHYFGRGGALAIMKASDVIINNTPFAKNRAYDGGALWSAGGDLTITGCSFSENSADHLWVYSDLFLNALSLAAMASGADVGTTEEKLSQTIATLATSPDAVRKYFSKETIGPEGGVGGALYAFGSNLKISGSTFSENSVERRGGAIYLISTDAQTGIAEITTSIFSQNSATQKGGALMNLQPGVKVDNCLFSNNQAGNMGGAIYSIAEITVTNTKLKENQAKVGGAVCANIVRSQHTYRDCVFTDNVAYNDTQEKIGEGGAIYAHGLKYDDIREPRSLMDLYDWLKIKVDPFSDVKQGDNHLQIDGCSFTGNGAYRGGALSLSYLHAECKNSDFSTNGVLNSGGAIYNRDFANLTIRHCDFTDNQADFEGGAIYNEGDNGGKLHVNRTLFDGNKVVMRGGAVADSNGEFEIKNSIFTHCSSGILQGSALSLNNTKPAKVINCTLVNNQQISSVIRAENMSVVTLTNNIITSNSTVENISANDVTWSSDSIVISSYNICALAGVGNCEKDTGVMVDPLNGNFHLRYDFLWGSLGAMDQGLNSAIDTNLDFDGNLRIIDNDGNGTATVDLGAYEANHVMITFKDGHPVNPLDIHGHVDASSETQWVALGGKPDYSQVNVIVDPGWAHAGWETFTRDKIRQTKHHFYQGEKIYATYDRYPTATFDFGQWGYYDDGIPPAQQIWSTLDCDPLAEPSASNIKTYNGWDFKGWSTTEGGTAAALPPSISDSAAFYAVYEFRQVSLTFSQGYEPAPNPSGDYNYGTRLDLADPQVIALADCDPNGNYLVGFVYGEDDYDPSDQDRVNIENFILDEDTTISGVYAPLYTSGGVKIVTDITKGSINRIEAETNGFLVDDPSSGIAFKNIPDGCEPVLQLITPNTSNFAGYTVSSVANDHSSFDLILTAEYLEPETHEKSQSCLLILKIQPQPDSKNRALRSTSPTDYAGLFVFPYGTVLDLTQAPYLLAPEPGYRFVGWVDNQGNPLTTVTITDDLEIFAVFEPVECNVTLQSDGNGIVQAPLLRIYDHGTTVELSSFTTIPNSGFKLDHWENETGETLAGNFVIHDDCTIKAVFEPTSFNLTVITDGNGSVNPSLPGSYPRDSAVTLFAHLAFPDSGYEFSGFVDENGDPVDSVLMNGDRQVTATFIIEQAVLRLFLQDGGVIMNSYPLGTEVNLSQFNGGNEGYEFSGFIDENGDPVKLVLMNADRDITGICTQANHL